MWLLTRTLRGRITTGALTVYDATGRRHSFAGEFEGPEASIRLHDRSLPRRLALNPGLTVGEAYMDGTLTFEDGSDIDDYIALFGANRESLRTPPASVASAAGRLGRKLQQFNPIRRAVDNSKFHYELNEELFELFLDSEMHYSCAYWTGADGERLEEAQSNKARHIAAKLDLSPGMEVLDIGSGWGAFAIYLATRFDVRVTAANVATEQIAAAERRARARGVADRITFVEKDYREISGTFDRVVSIEMLEHVGGPHLSSYFRSIRNLLSPGGFAVIVSAGRMTPPGSTGPFVRKYIFPGGYAPALSEVFRATESAGLWVCDLEILRTHYAWTLREWLRRFRRNREKAVELYDERFCRMWEFYLRSAEEYFLSGNNVVFQIQVSRERNAVPIRRDYMLDTERALLVDESGESADASSVPASSVANEA